MSIGQKLRSLARRLRGRGAEPAEHESRLIADGWDDYARDWQAGKFAVLPGHAVRYLGDEWTAEDVQANPSTTYGLPPDVIARFAEYLEEKALRPYLPAAGAEGLEIGPGGGRLTALLLPRTRLLHLADASASMLDHLRSRFGTGDGLRYYLTDGKSLPPLAPASLDFVVAFDVFVHFEPRLVFWYLRQIARLLKPGGVGLIHYANLLTPIGWRQFESDLESNLERRSHFAAFGVMCPPVMRRFLDALGLTVVSADLEMLPRDAVAVFRRPAEAAPQEGHPA